MPVCCSCLSRGVTCDRQARAKLKHIFEKFLADDPEPDYIAKDLIDQAKEIIQIDDSSEAGVKTRQGVKRPPRAG